MLPIISGWLSSAVGRFIDPEGHRMKAGTILVTGGAGYIGSHVVLALKDAGRKVVVLDDLSTGRRGAVPQDVPLVEGCVGDRDVVASTIERHEVGAVLHFAGSIVVPESVEKPLAYYRNNTINAQALLETCLERGVDQFIFSSTAAVYGAPERQPIAEDTPLAPINPYGWSKRMFEQILSDSAKAHGLRYVALRYFNVAGADPAGRTGQCSPVATHLIKIASQVAVGSRPEIAVFGNDYPTADGTCIRDYVHVTDLADAHVRALDHLEGGGTSRVFNIGYGRGRSILEVLKAFEDVLGKPLPMRFASRRAGDPPELVAAGDRLRAELGWVPMHDDLRGIVETAVAWERRCLEGDILP
jgi:UDP-glucose 4-epimerase